MMTNEQQRLAKRARVARGFCKSCLNRPLPNHKVCEVHHLVGIATHWLGSGSMDAVAKLRDKLKSQNYRCPYTGDLLIIGQNCHLDHIYPLSRFTELQNNIDNLEWVSIRVNRAKQDMTKAEFLSFVNKIVAYTRKPVETECSVAEAGSDGCGNMSILVLWNKPTPFRGR